MELSELDEELAREGRRLAEQLMIYSSTPTEENPHARDDMELTIRVEEQGDSREFTMKSMSLTREFADLLSWLKQRLRERHQG